MKREEILKFIKEYACREGILPTYREIGEGVGLSSVASVFCHMARLAGEGEIEWVGKRYRVKGLRYESDLG